MTSLEARWEDASFHRREVIHIFGRLKADIEERVNDVRTLNQSTTGTVTSELV